MYKVSLFLILIFSSGVIAQVGYQNGAKMEKPVVTISPRLGDRYFIASTLKELFGPAGEKIIFKQVYSQATPFGGPCDIYNQQRPLSGAVADPHSTCFGGNSDSALPLNPKVNLLQGAYINKACNLLINDQKSFHHLLDKTFAGKTPQVNAESVALLFKRFNPAQAANEKVLRVLQNLAASYSSLDSKWKGLANLLCLDPGWRIL
ncbi:MAG: hypothetical protein HN509_15380 [Halobacteriovoraceae bacterium]|jgi:hypothetical protein|nr:hypothetical protein [Halobacteriovoraceae bacterium]MBT5093481.1 hypothetical protein [Halobacteriovoraceae bacterium]